MARWSDDLPARLVAVGAKMLAGSVLADSAIEHYRGSFRNPAMVLPLAASSLSLATGNAPGANVVMRRATQGGTAAIGLIGLGFHLFNVGKRPGGASFTNLFHGAPLGAPAALVLAGVVGAVADGLRSPGQALGPVPLGSGRAVAALAAVGIIGTVAEVGLLHFRGAFQRRAMWLPVTIPPLAAAALVVDITRQRPSDETFALLGATFVLGIAGVGFHAHGVSRRMGGWRNWQQNLLDGPPIPAPPAFTGLALVGLAGLLLMRRRARG